MIRLLQVLFFLLISGNLSAQIIVNVLDGFTLEPIKEYELSCYSKTLHINELSASTFQVEEPRKGSKIAISSPGFITDTLELPSGESELLDVILYPGDSLLREFHSHYDIYTALPEVLTDTALISGTDKQQRKEEKIYIYVDTPAEFPGGPIALKNFLSTNIHYPYRALELGISGRVYAKMVISSTGAITDVQINRGTNLLFDKESYRVVKNMPDWKPGYINGKAVSSYFIIPINFIVR